MSVYNHIGQVVSDLERSRQFYEQVLGFRLWYEGAPPDALTAPLLGLTPPLGTQVYYLALGEFTLELIHFNAPGATAAGRRRAMNEPGLTHLSVSVEDIRATAQQAVAFGGTIDEDSDVGVALLIRDPDGQIVELLSKEYPGSRPPRPASS